VEEMSFSGCKAYQIRV